MTMTDSHGQSLDHSRFIQTCGVTVYGGSSCLLSGSNPLTFQMAFARPRKNRF